LSEAPETAGDQVLVNKTAFAFRRPRRWEVVVFRLFGIVFVKRVVGLPGEAILLRDGDVYVDGKLARKTFAQARAMRVLVFDQRFRPADGPDTRWERQPKRDMEAGTDLLLDGQTESQTLTFRNEPAVNGKYPALRDEYAYNAGLCPSNELVHDFLIATDVEVTAGQGTLALRLCDGLDWVEVTLPAGHANPVRTRSWPAGAGQAVGWNTRDVGMVLRVGCRHHVEMAFVDRRISVCVDGRMVVENVDLPPPGQRPGVSRPVQMEAGGAAVVLRNFRLYRDIHYVRRGSHGVGRAPVRLGEEQYFVLGDNSPNSEDSRFWPPDALSSSQLIGPAFLVHLPSQPLRWQAAGRAWQCQLPDIGRMRLLR
jgi:signal peptidase I